MNNSLTKIALAAALVIPAVANAAEPAGLTQKSIQRETFQKPMLKVEKESRSKAPAKAAIENMDVIMDPPPGKLTRLTQEGAAYKLDWGDPLFITYSGVSTEIIEGNDGFVYLKNPLSHFTTSSYIKGKKVDDTYVFDLPQNIQWTSQIYGSSYDSYLSLIQKYQPENPNDLYCYRMANSEKAQEAGLPKIDNKLVIKIQPDGSLVYTCPEDMSVIYGMVSNVSTNWLGYAEVWCKWTAFKDQPVTVPEGLQTTRMTFLYDNTGHYVKVGYDNNDVYIQGIFEPLPEAWIKGRKNGNKITIPTDQYLGYYDYDHTDTYCMTVTCSGPEYDPVNQEEYYSYAKTEELVFTVDEATGTLSAPGQALLYAPGKGSHFYYGLHNPVIKPISANLNPNPAKASGLIYIDAAKPNWPKLQFTVSNKNEDGEILDVNSLFYSIYVDNEPLIFQSVLYKTLTEDTQYIPFAYHDGRDFFVRGNDRAVYFYLRGADKYYGVKVVNIDPETKKVIGESELVQIQGNSSVDGINADKDIESVKYINLNGCEVAEPTNGVYMKVVEYTDGTKKTTKVVK